MEPLKPSTKKWILEMNPQAAPEIEEYERLLSLRFTVDPDLPAAPPFEIAGGRAEDVEDRLKVLYEKLFQGRPLER